MALEHQRVQRALIQAGRGGVFHPVTYNANNGEATVNEAVTLTPTSTLANETDSTFEEAERSRRARRGERTGWRWELRMQFAAEVSCEAFEQSLLDKPILLARGGGFDRQITLELTNAEYEHPPQQNPVVGSRAVFIFDANLSPA